MMYCSIDEAWNTSKQMSSILENGANNRNIEANNRMRKENGKHTEHFDNYFQQSNDGNTDFNAMDGNVRDLQVVNCNIDDEKCGNQMRSKTKPKKEMIEQPVIQQENSNNKTKSTPEMELVNVNDIMESIKNGINYKKVKNITEIVIIGVLVILALDLVFKLGKMSR
jgi:hypothetical protein